MRTIPSATVVVLAVAASATLCAGFAVPPASRTTASMPSSVVVLRMAQRMTPTRKTRREDSFDRDENAEEDKEDEEELTDYIEAQSKMKEDENRKRVEDGEAVGLTKQDEEEFFSKKDEFADMRAKIRARASEEGIEKSLVSKQVIEEATQRAMAGTRGTGEMLDLSGFGDKFAEDPADQLTDEEQAEIDAIASMPIFDQVKEELSNTRFPTPVAVLQTACAMAIIFAVSATLILKGDVIIRDFYMGLGFIPRPDEIYDFSDLDLPDGFTEQQNLESNIKTALSSATEIADGILKSSP